MKTTLNPFENAKRTANGTGGGVSPAVIEEMQAEISILGSHNETQAQDITDIKGSLNSINDNLTTLLNKVSYQSIDISTLTKYTDVEDLIMGSLVNNKCPYIIAEVTQSSYTFHNMRLNFARSGYDSTNIFTFSNVIDHSSIWTVDISMTGTSIRVSSTTASTFSNAKLYY